MTINIFNNKDMKTQILNCLHRCTIFGNSYSWDFGYKKFSSHPPPPTPHGGLGGGGVEREQYYIDLFRRGLGEGEKSLDFTDFKKVAHIMRVNGHLSKDGLDQILKIKAGMNKGRSFVS